MNLFTYLLSKKGKNSLVYKGDLFSYLLGKSTPKEVKTATGTTISILDAVKEKIVSLTLSKESTQETTTGKNVLSNNAVSQTINGVNFIKNKDGTINVDGTANGQIIFTINDSLELLSGDYVLSGCPVDGSANTYEILAYGGLSATYRDQGTAVRMIATGNGKTMVNIVIRNGAVCNNLTFKPMIVNGTEIVNYEPYTGGQPSPNPDYPQEIKTVKGYRNLFDKDNVVYVNGKILNDNGVEISDAGGYTKMYIEVDNNKNYYISGLPSRGAKRIYYFDENKNFISRSTPYTATNFSFILPTNCKFIDIQYSQVGNDFNTYMLTEGTQELPYVPYGTNWIYTEVSNGSDTNYYTIPLNGNEIVGIGDYKDELIVDKNGHCWLNKKTGKVVLDGSEGYTIASSTTARIAFEISVNDIISYTNSNDNPNLISNRYIPVSYSATWKIGNISRWINRHSLVFVMNPNMTITQFKEWLSTHNTDVYYVLETSQLIDLNYTVDISLYKPISNVSNSDNMFMVLKYY